MSQLVSDLDSSEESGQAFYRRLTAGISLLPSVLRGWGGRVIGRNTTEGKGHYFITA